MKKALIQTLGNDIDAFLEDNPSASLEDIIRQFGTPEEIANGLETRDDLEKLKRNGKRSRITGLVVGGVLAVILALVIVFLLKFLPNLNGYYTSYVVSDGMGL